MFDRANQGDGTANSTFLIDEKGVLQQEWRKVRVPGHAQAVLDELRSRL